MIERGPSERGRNMSPQQQSVVSVHPRASAPNKNTSPFYSVFFVVTPKRSNRSNQLTSRLLRTRLVSFSSQ